MKFLVVIPSSIYHTPTPETSAPSSRQDNQCSRKRKDKKESVHNLPGPPE